jgi:uncharacterized damage-inducible protein DinB
VPDEGYYKDQGISIGSIHKLLVHAMAAQWIWLSRWRGESPTRSKVMRIIPPAIRSCSAGHWCIRPSPISWARNRPKRWPATFNTATRGGELFALSPGELMLHVIDHATYHRGQLNTMIKHAAASRQTCVQVLPDAETEYRNDTQRKLKPSI